MAKLIDLRGAPEGAVVWEECDIGAGTAPVKIVRKDRGGVFLHDDNMSEDYYHSYKENCLRYWDSEPTAEEREAERWLYR